MDAVVPPMSAKRAIKLIRTHIHKDVALYKKEALFSLVAQKPLYLSRGWALGFRHTPDKYKTHLDFVIGHSNKAWGLLYRFFAIPSIYREHCDGFARVIRAWLARARPVEDSSF